ncbi:Aromatic ring-opening dioxygenase catalytic subunit (LigB family) OS=Castellaniella defragrans OX=75697 GN=HNR28_002726 PE=3 SV=1 [Castellaniella defragrans]
MRQPVYFVSHGGGPWPWMPEQQPLYVHLTSALQGIPQALPREPTAILMISAHWITRGLVQVASHPHPDMVYDYYGFQAHTYDIQYPAPGAPALAARVEALLSAHGIPVEQNPQRGYNHGAFVPAYVMYPQAQVPMVQLSIEASFDPAFHHALGTALRPLRDENVLIIGSGLTYHNLRRFGPPGQIPSVQFDAWLQKALIGRTPKERRESLSVWESAPGARLAHPVEDHLVPLFAVDAAAGEDGAVCFHHETDAFGGLTVSSFRYG